MSKLNEEQQRADSIQNMKSGNCKVLVERYTEDYKHLDKREVVFGKVFLSGSDECEKDSIVYYKRSDAYEVVLGGIKMNSTIVDGVEWDSVDISKIVLIKKVEG